MHVLVFVLDSLSPAQKAVQACHACMQRIKETKNHQLADASLVLYGVKDFGEVKYLLDEHANTNYSAFQEPDLDNIETAIATDIVGYNQRKLFKKYKLVK